MQTAQPPLLFNGDGDVEFYCETTVMLFDGDGGVESRSVWSGTGEIYCIMQKLTGYKKLDMFRYNMSHEDTNLIVAIYVSSEKPVDGPLNVQLSHALGTEVFGKALLVCFEDEAQYEWTHVISHQKLLEKLDKRGKPVSVYHDKFFPGLLGDLLRELHDIGIKK
jgi:hypothetical protein